MITEEEIYKVFLIKKARFNKRGFRLPKNWNEFFEKMNEKKKQNLKLLAKYLNTKWSNIDLERYIECGIELFGKGFTYSRFFDKKIIKHYIVRDREFKREIENVESGLKTSISFVDSLIRDCNTSKLFKYVNTYTGFTPRAVEDYLKNRIEKYFLVWLISNDYLKLKNYDKSRLVYINEQYNKYLGILNKFLQQNSMEDEFKKIL